MKVQMSKDAEYPIYSIERANSDEDGGCRIVEVPEDVVERHI